MGSCAKECAGEGIKYAGCVQNEEGFEKYPKWSIGIV